MAVIHSPNRAPNRGRFVPVVLMLLAILLYPTWIEASQPDKAKAKSSPAPIAVTIQSIKSANNQIIIQTSGNAAWRPAAGSTPLTIMVDLPNTKFDPSKLSSVIPVQQSYLQKIQITQISQKPDISRVTVNLKQTVKYSIKAVQASKQIIIQFMPPVYKVVIDPGHGGQDVGAKGVSGHFEKEFNLSVGLKVRKLLQSISQIQPFLTRYDDTYIPLDDRTSLANSMNADLYLSIHANTYDNASFRGTTTFYSREASKAFAEVIQQNVLQATKFPNLSVRTSNFRVIKDTKMPAVLVEVGFLTNKQEEAQLFTNELQNRVAAAITAGITQYLHISNN